MLTGQVFDAFRCSCSYSPAMNELKLSEFRQRHLADLYRIPGFQVLSQIYPHPDRRHALVLRLRRKKKRAHAHVVISPHG